MSISASRRRKAQQEVLSQAQQELSALRSQLADAYGIFNRTVDPALLEASILEISALQVRCDRLLRSIKDMNGDLRNAVSRASHPSVRRGRADFPAAPSAQETDQVGI